MQELDRTRLEPCLGAGSCRTSGLGDRRDSSNLLEANFGMVATARDPRQLALPAKPLQIVPYYAHPDFGWSYESPGGAEARFVVVFSMTSLVKGRTITITDVRVDAGKPKITSLTLGTFEPVTDLLTHRVTYEHREGEIQLRSNDKKTAYVRFRITPRQPADVQKMAITFTDSLGMKHRLRGLKIGRSRREPAPTQM
jgi:hypothetical protein